MADYKNHSSSTTIPIPDGHFSVSGAELDDIFITQQLLNDTKPDLFDGGADSRRFSHYARNQLPPVVPTRRLHAGTSNTWTSSEGELPSELDAVDDRIVFISEFNRIAERHGVRPIIVADFEDPVDDSDVYGKPGSWFSRKVLRRTSSTQSITMRMDQRPGMPIKHKRSISDLSTRLKGKHDKLKDKDLQELVRLCGSSLLYLPTEYATGSLAVPTCFRATAQYLIQHAPTTRGIFRIPGSHTTVALLYNHYCTFDDGGDMISGTVRCPTLPEHIPCDIHDVASAFKRFLSGLPGGVLGSLRTFDALLSIQTQLYSEPEWTKTKRSKARARMIALVIFTVRSQYRRDLICAVFGLLSLIGRAAENAKREDERGRPLPTSDLMGYGPLSIVFGPLLIGDLLEGYSMRLADPRNGLVLLPISPPKSRKERKKQPQITEHQINFNAYVDKIKVASGVLEMMITHWREVVRHMRNLKAGKPLVKSQSLANVLNERQSIRPSASENFALRRPPEWSSLKLKENKNDPTQSPTRADVPRLRNDSLQLHRLRSQGKTPYMQSLPSPLATLAPRVEERGSEGLSQKLKAQIRDGSDDRSAAKPSRKNNDRGSTSSKYSKRSRKSDATEQPACNGKLRKPRPPQKSGDSQLSISRTRLRLPRLSPADRLKTPVTSSSAEMVGRQEDVPASSTKAGEPQLASPFKQFSMLNPIKLFDPFRSSHTAIPSPNHEVRIRSLRRVADSEPTQKPIGADVTRRKVSRSLNLPSRGYKAINKIQVKDALSSVSHEDDIASLTALARVIKNEDVRPVSLSLESAGPSPGRTSSPAAASPAGILRSGHFDTKLWQEQKNGSESVKVSRGRYTSLKTPTRDSSGISVPVSVNLNIKRSFFELKSRSPKPASQSVRNRPSTPNPVKANGSPGVSVRALAARFNNAQSPLNSENEKSLAKHSRPGTPFSSRKDALLARYTTNTPSPVRLSRSSHPSQADISQDGNDVVKQYVIPIAVNVAVLSTTDNSKETRNVPRDNMDGEEATLRIISNPVKQFIDSCVRRTPLPPTTTQENIIRTLDGHDSLSSGDDDSISRGSHSSRSTRTEDCSMEREQVVESSLHEEGLATDGKNTEARSTPYSLGSVPDDPSIPSSVTREGDAENYSASANVPRLTSNHQDTVHIPVRSNSILHAQLRELQKQLVVKSDEIKHLKQQLDARSHLDIGTLSEQLRAAKQEAKKWKIRAEISEKQVEVLSERIRRTPSFKSFRSRPELSTLQSEEVEHDGESAVLQSSMEEVVGGAKEVSSASENDQEGIWGSEETTSTVVRTHLPT